MRLAAYRHALFVFIVLALLAGYVSACAAGGESLPSYRDLTTPDAFKLFQENRDKADFVILDVRTPAEYNEGHIPGAVLVNFYDRDFQDKLAGLDKEKRYFVYCRSGSRSSQAAATMIDIGLRSVYNLDAGIIDWNKAGYPLVK